VRNADALARGLLERGFDLVSGGTDNHLILIDLTSKGVPGKLAAKALDRARITTNYNTVPFDPRKPFDPSGMRLGTPASPVQEPLKVLRGTRARAPSLRANQRAVCGP